MAVDNVITSSVVGIDGNSYTDNISNDKLTNDDFLKLMMEEMKMQDPTKPMDSAALMDSQLKMSTIESNMDMAESMKSLQASYAASSLSTAANMIGHTIKDGSTGSDGLPKIFSVDTVENIDGELYVNAREIVGVTDALKNPETEELIMYDSDGFIYEDDAKTENRVALDNNGRFTYNDDGSLMLLDEDGNVITDEDITSKYAYAGSSHRYSETKSSIALKSISEVS